MQHHIKAVAEVLKISLKQQNSSPTAKYASLFFSLFFSLPGYFNVFPNGANTHCYSHCMLSHFPLGSGLSDNVSFSCTLLGMLAYYSSNSCCFSKAFSMSVYSTLVVGSPAISVDVFYSVHLSLCSNKAKHVALSNTGPLVWNKLE